MTQLQQAIDSGVETDFKGIATCNGLVQNFPRSLDYNLDKAVLQNNGKKTAVWV